MNRVIALLVGLGGLCAYAPAWAAAPDPCIACHTQETPGIVAYWEGSAHASAETPVACAACHGTDVEASHAGRARVDAEVCGSCHAEPYGQHMASKHAISLKSGQGCTRNMPQAALNPEGCRLCHLPGSTEPVVQTECAMFLAQSPEMQRVGCGACHRVEESCETCHTKHGTDTRTAGLAETCGVCHMGPDHAQYEMWSASEHGVLHGAYGEPTAPTCTTCHMQGGSHNISQGIATGKPAVEREAARAEMVDVCARCHTRAMAGRSLGEADAIEEQSRALLFEAQGIVQALAEEGLLEPAPGERPGHPIFGNRFVIGPHMIYEDISSAEATFFRMMLFNYMSAFKGAFHQSPDYAHWFGNAPLKLNLSDLKSHAALLRQAARTERRLENLMASPEAPAAALPGGEAQFTALKAELRRLRDRVIQGELDEEAYRREAGRALDRYGF